MNTNTLDVGMFYLPGSFSLDPDEDDVLAAEMLAALCQPADPNVEVASCFLIPFESS